MRGWCHRQLLRSLSGRRTYTKHTLEHVRGSRKLAAEVLGISLGTLQNRIAASREEANATAPGEWAAGGSSFTVFCALWRSKRVIMSPVHARISGFIGIESEQAGA